MKILLIKEFEKVKIIYLIFASLIFLNLAYFLINLINFTNINSSKDMILQIIYTKNINFFYIDILNLVFAFVLSLTASLKEKPRLKLLNFLPLKHLYFKTFLAGFLLFFIILFAEICIFFIIFECYFIPSINKILVKFFILNFIFSAILYICAIFLVFSKNRAVFINNLALIIILTLLYFKFNPSIINQKAFYLNENLFFYLIFVLIFSLLNLHYTIFRSTYKILLMIFSAIILNLAIFLVANKVLNSQYIDYRVKFSPILNDFIVTKFDLKNRQTSHFVNDKILSEDEYFYNLPFDFYYYLSSTKNFPPTLDFFENDTSLITLNSQTTQIKRDDYKNFPLVGLIESKPKYLKLKYPDLLIDFEKKEILNLNNLKIDSNKTTEFREIFHQFNFPLKNYYQNSTIFKSFDDGIFLVDSSDKIWHLKLINSKLYLKDTKLQKAPLFIKVDENPRFEYHAIFVSQNELGLISYDDYKFIKLPINEDFKSFDITYEVTPLHKIITLQNEKTIITYILNPNYSPFKKHILNFDFQKSPILAALIPLKIEIINQKYKIILGDLSFEILILNFILALVFIKNIRNFIFVLIFGVGGFISVLAYNKRKNG